MSEHESNAKDCAVRKLIGDFPVSSHHHPSLQDSVRIYSHTYQTRNYAEIGIDGYMVADGVFKQRAAVLIPVRDIPAVIKALAQIIQNTATK